MRRSSARIPASRGYSYACDHASKNYSDPPRDVGEWKERSDKLLTDRSSYIEYLERQLEAVAARCLTVDRYDRRIEEHQAGLTACQEQLKDAIQLMERQQQEAEEREALQKQAVMSLSRRLTGLESVVEQMRSSLPSVADVDAMCKAHAGAYPGPDARQQEKLLAEQKELEDRLKGSMERTYLQLHEETETVRRSMLAELSSLHVHVDEKVDAARRRLADEAMAEQRRAGQQSQDAVAAVARQVEAVAAAVGQLTSQHVPREELLDALRSMQALQEVQGRVQAELQALQQDRTQLVHVLNTLGGIIERGTLQKRVQGSAVAQPPAGLGRLEDQVGMLVADGMGTLDRLQQRAGALQQSLGAEEPGSCLAAARAAAPVSGALQQGMQRQLLGGVQGSVAEMQAGFDDMKGVLQALHEAFLRDSSEAKEQLQQVDELRQLHASIATIQESVLQLTSAARAAPDTEAHPAGGPEIEAPGLAEPGVPWREGLAPSVPVSGSPSMLRASASSAGRGAASTAAATEAANAASNRQPMCSCSHHGSEASGRASHPLSSHHSAYPASATQLSPAPSSSFLDGSVHSTGSCHGKPAELPPAPPRAEPTLDVLSQLSMRSCPAGPPVANASAPPSLWTAAAAAAPSTPSEALSKAASAPALFAPQPRYGVGHAAAQQLDAGPAPPPAATGVPSQHSSILPAGVAAGPPPAPCCPSSSDAVAAPDGSTAHPPAGGPDDAALEKPVSLSAQGKPRKARLSGPADAEACLDQHSTCSTLPLARRRPASQPRSSSGGAGTPAADSRRGRKAARSPSAVARLLGRGTEPGHCSPRPSRVGSSLRAARAIAAEQRAGGEAGRRCDSYGASR